MRGTVRTLCFLACFALAVTTSAQEGHPLVESGHGDWGTGATGRQDLTVSKNGKPLANARSVVMASTGKKLGAGSSEGVTPQVLPKLRPPRADRPGRKAEAGAHSQQATTTINPRVVAPVAAHAGRNRPRRRRRRHAGRTAQ